MARILADSNGGRFAREWETVIFLVCEEIVDVDFGLRVGGNKASSIRADGAVLYTIPAFPRMYGLATYTPMAELGFGIKGTYYETFTIGCPSGCRYWLAVVVDRKQAASTLYHQISMLSRLIGLQIGAAYFNTPYSCFVIL